MSVERTLEINAQQALATMAQLENALGKVDSALVKGKTSSEGYTKAQKGASEAMKGGVAQSKLLTTAMTALGFSAGQLLTSAFRKLKSSVVGLVSGFANFQDSILKIQALTSATDESMETLTESIIRVGTASIYTATEVAKASAEISKLGYRTGEQGRILSDTVALATGTQEDLSVATIMVGKTLRMFQKDARETADVADTLAVAVSKSGLDLRGLGNALQYAGSMGQSAGLELEDVSAHMAVLADRGQVASRAGRQMANIYTDMADDGSKINEFFRLNNIQLDTVAEKMEWLSKSNIDATTAGALFTREQARVAVVFGTTGDALVKMNKEMENAKGTAKEMEKVRLKGLRSQWLLFQSAITEGALILGKALEPFLQTILNGQSALRDLLNEGGTSLGGLREMMRVVNVTLKAVSTNLGILGVDTVNVLSLIIYGFEGFAKIVGTVVIASSMVIDSIKTMGEVAITTVSSIGRSFKLMWNFLSNPASGFGNFKKNFAQIWKENDAVIRESMLSLTERQYASGDATVSIWFQKGKESGEAYVAGVEESTNDNNWVLPSPDGKKGKKQKAPKMGKSLHKSFFGKMMGVATAEFVGGGDEEIDAYRKDVLSSGVDFGVQLVGQAQSIADSIFQVRQNAREREASELSKKQKAELRGATRSSRATLAIQAKHEKEQEKLRKESAEKQRKMDIAQALIGLASGIASIWSTSMTLGPVAGPVMAGINTAMLTGVTVAQIAAMSSQKFRDGGFVDGYQGSTAGPDNRVVEARAGEAFLNGAQQREFMDIANGKKGSGGINVNIENFSGNDEDLDRLERGLSSLRANGRFEY